MCGFFGVFERQLQTRKWGYFMEFFKYHPPTNKCGFFKIFSGPSSDQNMKFFSKLFIASFDQNVCII